MKKLIAILLCLMLIFSLAACAGQTPNPEPAPEPETGTETEPENNAEPEPEPEPEPAPEPAGPVSVGFLKGPTGMGAAYFMEQVENGDYGDTYKVTLDTDRPYSWNLRTLCESWAGKKNRSLVPEGPTAVSTLRDR